MIDWKARADQLLEEFNLCIRAKPRHDAINIQLEKDAVSKWAVHLNNQRGWGTDTEIAEACHQLEPRLTELKKKLIIEILQNGTV
jgi:hypothetical protein